jgi:hypothetical protein
LKHDRGQRDSTEPCSSFTAWQLQPGEFRDRGKKIDEFGQVRGAQPNRLLDPGCANKERNPGACTVADFNTRLRVQDMLDRRIIPTNEQLLMYILRCKRIVPASLLVILHLQQFNNSNNEHRDFNIVQNILRYV